MVYLMRSLEKGHSGAKKFCALMNMPPPPGAKPFSKNSKTITGHVKSIVQESMRMASAKISSSKMLQRMF